ncbi:MAG: hypothetical protein KA163_00375 [Bacteroidia bacterium]|nr:hypothetical protein [Bacteroidia bacterium]
MKRFLFTLLIVSITALVKAQTIMPTIGNGKLIDESMVETNTSRYQIDYEIKGWNGAIKDSDKINQLDLNFYDSKRLEKDDIELFDSVTGLTVIVYSEKKTTQNKSK